MADTDLQDDVQTVLDLASENIDEYAGLADTDEAHAHADSIRAAYLRAQPVLLKAPAMLAFIEAFDAMMRYAAPRHARTPADVLAFWKNVTACATDARALLREISPPVETSADL